MHRQTDFGREFINFPMNSCEGGPRVTAAACPSLRFMSVALGWNNLNSAENHQGFVKDFNFLKLDQPEGK